MLEYLELSEVRLRLDSGTLVNELTETADHDSLYDYFPKTLV